MDKISAYTNTADGNDEFTEGDPSTGTPATEVDGGWLNGVQRELLEVMTQMGLTPSDADDTLVWQALQAVYGKTFSGDPNGNVAANVLRERCWDTSTSPPTLYIATAADGTTGGTTWVRLPRLADETQRGIVELATTAEAQAGTDTERAVTPAGLAAFGSSRVATGTYTGDGTTAQDITGIGFQPVFVKIWRRRTTEAAINVYETTDTIIDDITGSMSVKHNSGGGHSTESNRIIGLLSDGFRVDDDDEDGDPNANGITYNYLAIG